MMHRALSQPVPTMPLQPLGITAMPVADPLIGAPIYTDYPTTTPMVGTTGMALEPGGIAPAYTDWQLPPL